MYLHRSTATQNLLLSSLRTPTGPSSQSPEGFDFFDVKITLIINVFCWRLELELMVIAIWSQDLK